MAQACCPPSGLPLSFLQDLSIGMKEKYYIGVTNKDPEKDIGHPALAGCPGTSPELVVLRNCAKRIMVLIASPSYPSDHLFL